MLITTTESVAGHEIKETLGLVKGNTIQTRHVGSHIVAALTNIVGGEEILAYGTAVKLR